LKVYKLYDEYKAARGVRSRPWVCIRFISSAQEIKDMSDTVARYPRLFVTFLSFAQEISKASK